MSASGFVCLRSLATKTFGRKREPECLTTLSTVMKRVPNNEVILVHRTGPVKWTAGFHVLDTVIDEHEMSFLTRLERWEGDEMMT